MTTPNPMSVVIEALERIDQKNYITGGGYYDLETRDLCAATLPLARSMQEKLERYDELVKYKEALEWIIANFGHTIRELAQDIFDAATEIELLRVALSASRQEIEGLREGNRILHENNVVLIERATSAEAKNTQLAAQVAVLKSAWLEIRMRELRSQGMKVEQAKIHAEAQLSEANLPAEAEKLVRLVEAVGVHVNQKGGFLGSYKDVKNSYRDLRGDK